MNFTPELRHFSHDDLPDIRQTLIDVHADVHAARMADDEFRRRFPCSWITGAATPDSPA